MFNYVNIDDFCIIDGRLPSHFQIVAYLEKLGGGGYQGKVFAKSILGRYGWAYDHFNFDVEPELAVAALNKAVDQITLFESKFNAFSTVLLTSIFTRLRRDMFYRQLATD